MVEKIFLDNLNENHVRLKKQNYVNVDGVEYPIDQPWMISYDNSVLGRELVNVEVPEPYKTAIFVVWGDSPTIEDVAV